MRNQIVGRERELGVLQECLAAALRRTPRLALCQGEPGIGKTRLATELVDRARQCGALVAWGAAVDSSGAPPYWPWREVLRGLAESVDIADIARTRRVDADLAPLAPDLFDAASTAAPPRSDIDASPDDRFRQFDALTRVLRDVCRQHAVVLVLEDLHWADRPSILLLQHLARSVVEDPLLILANSRDAEGRHGDLVAALAREPITVLIDLQGLSAEATREQLTALLDEDVDAATAVEVYALTGGNPFFVREVCRAMQGAAGRDPFAAGTATVRETIAMRMKQLSTDTVRLLEAAAVCGRDFDLPVVADMVGVDAGGARDAAAEGVRAGLIEARGQLPQFGFVHALVRDAIESALPASAALGLHERAAEAIERQYGHHLGARLFDVARHRTEAAGGGHSREAAQWLTRAGEQALRELAYEDAARLLRQAVDVGGRDVEPIERCRTLIAAGRALHLAGDLGARLEVCMDAAELARTHGRADLLAEAALVMEAVGTPGFDLAARRLCTEALTALGEQDLALRARVTARLVETYVFVRRPPSVIEASLTALELAERSGDTRALATALRARQVMCVDPEGLDDRRQLAERMLGLGRDACDPGIEMSAHLWAVDVALESGDLAEVARRIDALAVCAQQVRGPVARFEVARCRAVLAQAQGRFGDARRLEAEAFAILAPTGHDVRFTFRSALQMSVGYHSGDYDISVTSFDYHGAPEGHAEMLGLIGQLAFAFALASAGRLDQAADMYRTPGPVEGWEPPPHVVLCAYAFGLGVALVLGETEDIAALHALLSPYREHHVVSGLSAMPYFGPVELWLGRAEHHLGDVDAAVADLTCAEETCAANGADGFRVEAQCELASALADRAGPGDVPQARRLLATATVRAAELGMTALSRRVVELLQRVDAVDATRLTRRELEVAELVGHGLTNRQLAERLFISERTAENHVQHILTKLGLANRSQLAVWAAGRK